MNKITTYILLAITTLHLHDLHGSNQNDMFSIPKVYSSRIDLDLQQSPYAASGLLRKTMDIARSTAIHLGQNHDNACKQEKYIPKQPAYAGSRIFRSFMNSMRKATKWLGSNHNTDQQTSDTQHNISFMTKAIQEQEQSLITINQQKNLLEQEYKHQAIARKMINVIYNQTDSIQRFPSRAAQDRTTITYSQHNPQFASNENKYQNFTNEDLLDKLITQYNNNIPKMNRSIDTQAIDREVDELFDSGYTAIPAQKSKDLQINHDAFKGKYNILNPSITKSQLSKEELRNQRCSQLTHATLHNQQDATLPTTHETNKKHSQEKELLRTIRVIKLDKNEENKKQALIKLLAESLKIK